MSGFALVSGRFISLQIRLLVNVLQASLVRLDLLDGLLRQVHGVVNHA